MPSEKIAPEERVVFKKGTTAFIRELPIVNGQIVYNTQTGESFLDEGLRRIAIGKKQERLNFYGNSDAVYDGSKFVSVEIPQKPFTAKVKITTGQEIHQALAQHRSVRAEYKSGNQTIMLDLIEVQSNPNTYMFYSVNESEGKPVYNFAEIPLEDTLGDWTIKIGQKFPDTDISGLPSKTYVDEQDAKTLDTAKKYADEHGGVEIFTAVVGETTGADIERALAAGKSVRAVYNTPEVWSRKILMNLTAKDTDPDTYYFASVVEKWGEPLYNAAEIAKEGTAKDWKVAVEKKISTGVSKDYVDNLVSKKLEKPEAIGVANQFLVSDGMGGTIWKTVVNAEEVKY